MRAGEFVQRAFILLVFPFPGQNLFVLGLKHRQFHCLLDKPAGGLLCFACIQVSHAYLLAQDTQTR